VLARGDEAAGAASSTTTTKRKQLARSPSPDTSNKQIPQQSFATIIKLAIVSLLRLLVLCLAGARLFAILVFGMMLWLTYDAFTTNICRKYI
jgi:hypothetical protein